MSSIQIAFELKSQKHVWINEVDKNINVDLIIYFLY